MSGSNSSEARLGALTRSTFLSLWAYQNPFFAPAKELCDVLVIFGDDVIVMSDKQIKLDEQAEASIAWKRWYRKAIGGSIRQLRGAKRQIKAAPGSIFSDSGASSLLPLKMPSPENMRVHLVAIASGCEAACLLALGHPSIQVDTRVTDGDTLFTVGTRFPEFVHVFTRTGLDAVFSSVDTTRDFLDYLERRQSVLVETSFFIHGEEELVGSYMLSQPGNAAFRIPVERFPCEDNVRIVQRTYWSQYNGSEIKRLREEARKPSFLLDRLIEHFAEEYRNSALIIGQELAIETHEMAFRLMASESRVGRQLLSAPLLAIAGEDPSTFWSTTTESLEVPGVVYVWLVYPPMPKDIPLEKTEVILLAHLQDYMLVSQWKFRTASRIIGLCLPNKAASDRTLIVSIADGAIWSQDMANRAKQLEKLGIMANTTVTTYFSIR
jgi:hypothetical protein